MDSSPSHDFDIAIIGAGLSGSCAAILAAQSGAEVVLLESNAVGRHKVCGEFLSPESRSLLSRLEVLEPMLESGAQSVTRVRILTSSRTSGAVSFPGAGLGFSRRALDTLLWSRALALGVEARAQTRVSRLEPLESGGFSLEASGQTISARYVISATGRAARWSRDSDSSEDRRGGVSAGQMDIPVTERLVSSALCRDAACRVLPRNISENDVASRVPTCSSPTQTRATQTPARFLGLKTHFRGARVPEGEVMLFPFEGGYCGLVGIEGGVVNACLLVSYTRSKGCAPDALWGSVTRENRALARAIEGATPCFEWVASGNVSFERAAPARDGVLRAGDAAGYIHPLTGDGMAMALRSGELAAQMVVRAWQTNASPLKAADDYARAWKSEFGGRLWWASRFQPLFTDARVTGWAQTFFDRAPALFRLGIVGTRGRVGG